MDAEELLMLEARVWREEEAKIAANPAAYLRELREKKEKTHD
jgi:hypothetical protein